MTLMTLPYWLEVVRAIGPTVGSLLLFATALTAAIVGWKTYRQRKEADDLSYRQRKTADELDYQQRKKADDRAEWWRRTQWAVDYAADEREEKAAIGLAALDMLQVSPLATADDRELLNTLYGQIIAARASRPYTGTTASTAERARAKRPFRWTRRGE